MPKSKSGDHNTLNRRQALLLPAAAGLEAALALPANASDSTKTAAHQAPGVCATPRSAVAKTQYGKVRGYVDAGVLTFKGIPYGQDTGGENRWLPAKAPKPWDGEYPALIYGANCPQRLHDYTAIEQSFLYDWDDGYMSEDMLKLNVWTPSLTGKRPVIGLFSRRRFHLRLRVRTALAGRRAVGPASRRRFRDSQSPPQPARIPGYVRDRRAGICRFGKRRHDGPGCVASLGPREHCQLRRRSGCRHDLWSVGRRLQGYLSDGHAIGRGPASIAHRRSPAAAAISPAWSSPESCPGN